MAEQTDIVELVKEKNPIEDVIEGDGFPMPKRGRYRKCSTAGTGGLVVDTQIQTYFWNTRNEHGDVIAWVQVHQRLEFKEAVEWLCARANLPAPNWKGESHAARIAARAKEDALDVALRVMRGWFWKSAEAQQYAQLRGWSAWEGEEDGERIPGTMAKALLGYSGEGSEAERAEMVGAFQVAGVDVDSPIAVAILGYKGDVTSWAKRHGMQLDDEWTLNGYIPGLLGRKRLVYPHVRSGRVRYLSARSIEGKFHFNLPVALVGERQPYYNYQYASGAETVIVVEGQADAVSLAQWKMDGVALAGVTPGEGLVEQLKRHKFLYVGLDADEAGKQNGWKVAAALGPLTRMINWRSPEYPTWLNGSSEPQHVKDANDLLRALNQSTMDEEGQRKFVSELLEKSPTYVEAICKWAGQQEGAARDQAMPQAIAVVSKLEEFQLSQYRSSLAKALGVPVREMANMIKSFAASTERAKTMGEPLYTWGGVIEDHLVEYLYNIENHVAYLAWRDPDGVINSGESVEIAGRLVLPQPPNEMMRTGAIAFPSALGNTKSIGELVTLIMMYLRSIYLMQSEDMARLISYWILTTWVYDCFETVIYLRAMGGAGSGKSELMKRIGLVCYRTMTANGSSSTSSLFRSLERYKGVVFIDEADIQNSDTENDMVKFYNLGAMKNNPIWRTVEVRGPNGEREFETEAYQTFCPKLVAMRKEFRDDAIGSRSLTFKLVPREMTELMAAEIPLSINIKIRTHAQALRNLLVRWRLETWQPEIEVDPGFYDMTISPRLNQVAGPLLAVAKDDIAEQDVIRKTLQGYYRESIINQSMTLTARVLEAMWKIWLYPDLHKEMVKADPEGNEMIKVNDITKIANQIIDEMNDEGGAEESQEDKGKDNRNAIKSRKVGYLCREEMQLKVSERRRDGFWVYWNGPRLEGLSTKFGITPADFGPQPGNGNGQSKIQLEQGKLA